MFSWFLLHGGAGAVYTHTAEAHPHVLTRTAPTEPHKALAEFRRLLKPGGLLFTATWGPREQCTMFNVFMRAAQGEDLASFGYKSSCRTWTKGALGAGGLCAV